MKRLFITLFLSTMLCIEAMAVPAITTPIKRTLPDGSEITIRLYGDEFFNYATTADGYNVVEHSDGYFYYATLEGSTLKKTAVRAHDAAKRSAADAQILHKIARGIPQSVVASANSQARRARGVSGPNRVGDFKNRVGTLKTLVILVNFADNEFTITDPAASIEKMLTEDGYNRNGSTGSAWNYYHDNSNGQFNLEVEVVGPYTLPQKMAYYGAETTSPDKSPDQMIVDACTAADADVNFAEFAEDGIIRDIFVFYAGVNQAEGGPSDTIWPHRWIVSASNTSGNTIFDGVKLQYYACSSELRGSTASLTNPDSKIANIGTFCHEFGHVLGWCDYYNTDNQTNTINLGALSLMNSGNYNNNSRTPPSISAFDRYVVGWLNPKEIITGGQYSLGTLNSTNEAYLINSDTEGEYFIIENRDKGYNWDKYMTGENGTSTADGMLIYHIDRTDAAMGKWYDNEPNVVSKSDEHECMKVVRPIQSRNVTNWFFPGKSNVVNISSETVPEYAYWSGASSGYTISNLTMGADKTAAFNITVSDLSGLSGIVSSFGGVPVSGVNIELYSLTESPSSSNKMRIAHVGATPLFTATTGDDGSFSITEIPVNLYTIKAYCDGYSDYTAEIAVSPRNQTHNITLYKPIVEENITRAAWHGDIASIVGFNGKTFGGGAAFALSDIPVTADKAMLAGADFYVYAPCKLAVKVFERNKDKAYRELCSIDLGTQTAGRWLYVDLTKQDIHIEGDNEAVVLFIMSDYDSKPLSFDGGPVVDGKGNLLYDNGMWDTYDKGNCLIGAYFSFPNAESATLTSNDETIYVGDAVKLAYTSNPSGSVAAIDWSAADESIVAFSDDYVLGKHEGITTVSGVYNNASVGEATFTVLPEIDNVKVEVDAATMTADVTWTANKSRSSWTLRYKEAGKQSFKTIKSDSMGVTLNNLTANTDYTIAISGERTILADTYWGEHIKEFTTPDPIYAESITLDKTTLEIYTFGNYKLSATVTPENAYGAEITWSSSDQAVATVDAEGLVSGISQGTATITAKTRLNDVTATCTVNVVGGFVEPTYECSQHDANITWEGSAHNGDWKITYGRMYGEMTTTTQKEKSLYLDKLAAGARYIVTIVAIGDSGEELASKEISLNTASTTGPFSLLCDIKGSYSASDDIVLRLGNITSAIDEVEWSVDGTKVSPPKIRLTAGSHTIVATVTLADGSTQKLIKYITVK